MNLPPNSDPACGNSGALEVPPKNQETRAIISGTNAHDKIIIESFITVFSNISKMSKETLKQHRAGLQALQRINKNFETCGRAARTGDPAEMMEAFKNLHEAVKDLSALQAAATKEAEFMTAMCAELLKFTGAPEMAPQLLEGYA